ncbi:hypothetical protein CTRI78_v009108 [Colletotrichum trifolii]|uniref:SET domain-containing protein n=1 Tax=Colletotrichum trifolii TaxID=5466 RepID=A0A4R8QX97_COLTR|nr:hypothetical protein CTRI78_v009108 [Colletotrichum trifolii]
METEKKIYLLDLSSSKATLGREFRAFQQQIQSKIPYLAMERMVWKTCGLVEGIMIGHEPDDEDEDGDYAYPWGDDPFSHYQQPNTGGSASGQDDSDDDEVQRHVSFGVPNETTQLAVTHRPLLEYDDRDGTTRSVIYSNEFIEVRQSSLAGWGAFAVKRLHKGDQILVERALYHAAHEEIRSAVQELSNDDREIANDLCAFYGRPGQSKEEAIWSTNAFATRPPKSSANKEQAVMKDVAGLFPVAARFNHSCEPTISHRYHAKEDVLVFSVLSWEIEEGDELTISYGKEPSDYDFKLYTDDDTLEKTKTVRWNEFMMNVFREIDCKGAPGPKLENWVEEAEFQNVYHDDFKIPLGPWPQERRLKDVGL